MVSDSLLDFLLGETDSRKDDVAIFAVPLSLLYLMLDVLTPILVNVLMEFPLLELRNPL